MMQFPMNNPLVLLSSSGFAPFCCPLLLLRELLLLRLPSSSESCLYRAVVWLYPSFCSRPTPIASLYILLHLSAIDDMLLNTMAMIHCSSLQIVASCSLATARGAQEVTALKKKSLRVKPRHRNPQAALCLAGPFPTLTRRETT